MFLTMDNVDDISERFPNLETVGLNHAQIGDLSGLLKLEKLKTLYVLEEQEDAVKELFRGKNVEIKIVD